MITQHFLKSAAGDRPVAVITDRVVREFDEKKNTATIRFTGTNQANRVYTLVLLDGHLQLVRKDRIKAIKV